MKVKTIEEFSKLYCSEYNGSKVFELDFEDGKMYGLLLEQFISNSNDLSLYNMIKDIYLYRFKGMKKPETYAYNYVIEEYNPENTNSKYLTRIGELFLNGEVFERNYQKAFEFFLRDEHRQSPNTMYYLGYFYYKGITTEVDYEKAFKYLYSSSEQHYYLAYKWLGLCYFYGQGVETKFEKAFTLFQKAIHSPLYNKGDVKYYVGLSYQYGYGIDKNIYKAVEHYYDSFKEGYQPAKDELLSLGFGLDVSFEKLEFKEDNISVINSISSDGKCVLLPEVTHLGYEMVLVKPSRMEGDYHHFKTTIIPAEYDFREKEITVSNNIKIIYINSDVKISSKALEIIQNRNIIIEKIC